MKNDVDLEDALRSRDKQNTIDLYVTSQVIDFVRDLQRRSPRKCTTTQLESFDPHCASSRHIPPTLTSSQPLLIEVLPLRSSPSKETTIIAQKIRTCSAPSALLYPSNTTPHLSKPNQFPQKQPSQKLQKLTPIRKASLGKNVLLKEGICEYGFETSCGVITRSVSAGQVKKEVHVGAMRSRQQGKEPSAQLTDSSVVTRSLRGRQESDVSSEQVSDKGGEQVSERAGAQLSEKEGKQVRGNGTEQLSEKGGEQVRNEGVEQVRNEGGQQVRSHGEQQVKVSAVDSLKQVRRGSKKSKGPSLVATKNRVVTRSFAEKHEVRKNKGKKKVSETRKAEAHRKANKGKQSGGDKGKSKVGVKRKILWESDESFSEEDYSLSEDSDYSEFDVTFNFGEQDVDEEEFCQKGEGEQNETAQLWRRRTDSQAEFDDSGED
ncbi:hypothetical protein RND81_02G116400 [Saponaria officinalis]|uniref:Uncharacterized protein n=1 Tax=Saponaria officinalis TaxID=3572 RepID=A0AAW1MXM1_SAPOF